MQNTEAGGPVAVMLKTHAIKNLWYDIVFHDI